MSVTSYAGCSEILYSDAEAAVFQNAIQDLKKTILAYGYAPEALDKLSFDLKAYTLNISLEDQKRGAWHRHANGQPFFELTISAPGSILTVKRIENAATTQQPLETQSFKLAFEFGINVANNMEKYLRAAYPGERFKDMCAGGASLPFENTNITTTFNVTVEQYMTAFVKACSLRLDYLAAEDAKLQATSPKPGSTSSTAPKPPAH